MVKGTFCRLTKKTIQQIFSRLSLDTFHNILNLYSKIRISASHCGRALLQKLMLSFMHTLLKKRKTKIFFRSDKEI